MVVSKKFLAPIIIVCLSLYCSIFYIAVYVYYQSIRNLCIPTLLFNISLNDEYTSCPVRYEHRELIGDTLVSILGQKDKCCEFCEKAQGCKGYTWTNERNGLCVLKSSIKDFVDNINASSGVGPELPGYFLPHGQDNTTPLDDTNMIKILPPNGCNSATKLIVGVYSAPTEFDRRKWIRHNWAKVHSNETKVIFVIANHKVCALNRYICPLKDQSKNISKVTGKLYDKSPVERDTNSKWYIPRYVYDKKFYPLYPFGPTYFITGRGTLQKLQDTLRTRTPFLVSENFRRLPEDAIYIGKVAKLAGIQLQDVGGINLEKVSYWSDASNGYQQIPLGSVVREDNREQIWAQMKASYTIISTTNSPPST
uniref:Hexosyltransferase n=1 Tax=Acrobeloides nanus TaxID=290746 RepID=A0A914DKR2_9BILA